MRSIKSANHKYAVLLAGGEGSRFWPKSRTLEPKQFLCLHEEECLFEQALNRIKDFVKPQNIFIATSELYRHNILEFTSRFSIPIENIVFEPEGKNTAPCIALVTQLIHIRDPFAQICIFPCDHLIQNKNKFIALLDRAFSVTKDNLVIFGIPPHRPATGYGYIKIKKHKSKIKGIYEVDRFLEKPDLKTAKVFIKDKRYFWNSGIFAGSSAQFLEAIKKCLPGLHSQIIKVKKPSDINKIWKSISPISFDYGVLEKTSGLLMLPAGGLGWSDMGSWQAWDELVPKDKEGNKFIADAINLGSKNITVLGSHHLIATIGVENLIVVDTPDALLITKKDRTEDVRKIVDILKENKRQEHYFHRTVRRPWGHYTVLDIGSGFKIKLVEVKPNKSLSLQFHKKRHEHWVVVDGRAEIVKNKKKYFVDSNQSTYIPASCIHRIKNPLNSILKIVEVQTGDYLEEDDIIRLKDDFGRHEISD